MGQNHSTGHIANALRRRARELTGHGVDSRELFAAADELDRLNECSSDEDCIGGRFTALERNIEQLKEMIMPLVPEVQALVDAVTAQGVQITAATAELLTLEGQATDLAAQIKALQDQIASGAAVDPDDLAAIVTATGTINASIATIKAAMPQPVPPPVVDAASNPPVPGAT